MLVELENIDEPPTYLEKIEVFFKLSKALGVTGVIANPKYAKFLLREAYTLVELHLNKITEDYHISYEVFCESIEDGKTKYIPD